MLKNRWTCCSAVILAGLIGCDAQNPAKAPARNVVAPPGIAPVGFDMENPGPAAPQQQAGANPQAQPMPQAVQQPMAQPMPANDGKGIIGKTTDQVVDYRVAMTQNPNLVIVENKAAGDDPITFAASAYVSARSQASMFGLQSAIKMHKVVEERPPTYAEFQKMMKENRIEFTAQYAWRMYAYDGQEGRLLVLEDPALKPTP